MTKVSYSEMGRGFYLPCYLHMPLLITIIIIIILDSLRDMAPKNMKKTERKIKSTERLQTWDTEREKREWPQREE